MRRLCAIGLILTLCCPSVWAAAGEPGLTGPLGRSAAREASRLAGERPDAATLDTWRAVRDVKPATPIAITTMTGTVTRPFIAADDTALFVLNVDQPGLTDDMKRRLNEMTLERSEMVAD